MSTKTQGIVCLMTDIERHTNDARTLRLAVILTLLIGEMEDENLSDVVEAYFALTKDN